MANALAHLQLLDFSQCLWRVSTAALRLQQCYHSAAAAAAAGQHNARTLTHLTQVHQQQSSDSLLLPAADARHPLAPQQLHQQGHGQEQLCLSPPSSSSSSYNANRSPSSLAWRWPPQRKHQQQAPAWQLQLQQPLPLLRALRGQHLQHNSSFSSSSNSASILPSPWLLPRGFATGSSADPTSTTTSSSSSSSSEPPKNLKGALPGSGPSRKTLRALPFTVPRAAAAEAFAAYHGKHWYQSRQKPLLAKPFKETYLPFWVGSGTVRVEVTGAEVGHEHLVTRYDRARNRAEPRWETVWSRAKLHLVWDRVVEPQEPEAQLYASWKYPRSDVEVLRPGPLVTLARPITPDMLQASPGAGTDTRRVGPFTVDPQAARRLLMSRIEATERQRAEAEVARLTGAQQVRFLEMHFTYMGSTGTAKGSSSSSSTSTSSAADGPGGLDLSPVYVPAFTFSWWHGGAKVRTFVSGVNPSAVAGVQVLDDTKLATYATLATAGVGLFLGLSANVLLWGALIIPFVGVGVVSRFWPLLRSTVVNWQERMQRKWKAAVGGKEDYCEVDWNADFVHAFEAEETRRRQQEQRQSFWQQQQDNQRQQQQRQQQRQQRQQRGPQTAQDPREFFEQFMRDPFSWFEQFAQQTRQQQQQGGYQQQYRQQQQQQQQYGGGSSRTRAGGGSSSGFGGGGVRGDPLGYYNTLGIKPGCSTQEVQAAFRGLALKHHPDRYTSAADKTQATKKFQTITEAYQVLRDPGKRQLYDAGQYHDRA